MNTTGVKSTKLITAILSLKNEDEARRFLRDLMTEKEIKEFSNRLRAAELLMQDVHYTAIEEETGLSSTTVARVSKWLKGSLGGYRLVLPRVSHHHHGPIQLRRGLS